MIADDVIRELVAAEPQGRPVVVVSSDNAVVRDVVRRRGPGGCGAAALTRLLARVLSRAAAKLSEAPCEVRPDVDRTDRLPREDPMSVHIDCDTCVVRGLACHDCVVTVLLGPPPELGFDEDEQRALDVLAGSGLVPPLRMVRPGVRTGRRVGLTGA